MQAKGFSNYLKDLTKDIHLEGASDQTKLLYLYCYNFYFGNDPLLIPEMDEGNVTNSAYPNGVQSIYVNTLTEEDQIEFGYYYVAETFDINKVKSIFKNMFDLLNYAKKRDFTNHKEAIERYYSIKDLEGYETIQTELKIVCNFDPTDEEKFEIDNELNKLSKSLGIGCNLMFFDDVIAAIESNQEPFEYVPHAYLTLDKVNNSLKFDDDMIVNISAKSLHDLWKPYGKRGLLAMNLRYFVKAPTVDMKIVNTILCDNNHFWHMNNGIIIVCDDYSINGTKLELTNFSIVNGGQTTHIIGETPINEDFFVVCKIIKNSFKNSNDKNVFVSNVAEASNTQKPIKIKDIIANRPEQRDLKLMLQESKIFCEIKRGDKCLATSYPEPWQRTKNNELGQDLYSLVYMEPGPARNSVAKILENENKYNILFKNHQYKPEFIKSVLILEKAYRDYSKKTLKLEGDKLNPDKKGIIKNGMFYTLGVIGFLLKYAYNKEFRNKTLQFINAEKTYFPYLKEMTFDHEFIKEDYESFLKHSKDLFNLIVDKITEHYQYAKESNPSATATNYTKSNVGFNNLIKALFHELHYGSSNAFITSFTKHIYRPTNEQLKANEGYYLEQIEISKKNNKEIESIEEKPLDDKEKEIVNELMIYRLHFSSDHHIDEKKVFSDTTMMKIARNKPENLPDLGKILKNATTLSYCGKAILDIINKYR